MRKIYFSILLTLLFSMSLKAQSGTADTLKIGAAVTTRILIKLAEPAFKAVFENYNVSSKIGPTGDMVELVMNGNASVAVTTRNIKDYEKAKCPTLVGTPIGRDGLVLSVHALNPVKNLTFAQIRDIWTGRIVNWKELGGHDLPIVVIGRTKAYDPIKLFCDFMKLESKDVEDGLTYSENGKEIWSKTFVAATETDDLALKMLLKTPGAITYFPLQVLDNYKERKLAVKDMSFDGVQATKATIEDGTYFIHRTLNVITNDEPRGNTQKFVKFLLSDKGQKIVKEAGFIAL